MVSAPLSFSVKIENPWLPDARRAKSHWDHDYARSLGYKKATVGGRATGFVTEAVAQAWGLEWFERGESLIRQRQPVYQDDEVQIGFSPIREEDGVSKSDFEVVTPEGVAAVVGWVGLRNRPAELSLADFPFTPERSDPVNVMAGEKIIGERLASSVIYQPGDPLDDGDPEAPREYGARLKPRLIPPELQAKHPELRKPGLLLPQGLAVGPRRPDLSWHETNIRAVVDSHTRLFNLPTVDDHLVNHSRVSGWYERKGSKYIKMEHLIVANERTPITWNEQSHIVFKVRAQVPAQA